MKYADLLVAYYNSKEFENFITNEKIIEFDFEFFSLDFLLWLILVILSKILYVIG